MGNLLAAGVRKSARPRIVDMETEPTSRPPKGFRAFWRWLKQQLVQGRDPGKASHAVATGVAVGVMPLYGPTTITCGLIGLKAGLNHAILQGFNYLMSPVKVLLLLPFIRLGEWMTGSEPLALSMTELGAVFRQGMVHAIGTLAGAVGNGVLGWAVSLPILYAGCYWVSKSILVLRMRRQEVMAGGSGLA